MTNLPWDPPGDNAVGREVAGALAAFWKGGNGPSASAINGAFDLAGVAAPEAGNKQERVRLAIRGADDTQARRAVEELLDLLRTAGTFPGAADPDVRRLRGALERIGATLTDDGFVDWPDVDPAPSPTVVPTPPPRPAATPPETALASATEVQDVSIDLLVSMLRRLPQAVRPLALRRRNRAPIPMDDEYDLQDLVEAVLRLTHADVRPEEHTPSSAGSSSRIDFLVKRERCAVETKVTRPGRAEREIKPEILVDIHDYQQHAGVDTLVIAIYDLGSTFSNPQGFESDLSGRHGDLDVIVVVAGWPAPPQR